MNVCHLGGFLFAAICLIQCSAVGQNVGPSSTQRPDAGSVQGNTFKSNFFGFSYRFPTGWTVLNQESQSRIRLAKGKLYTLLFAKSASPGRIINPSDAAIVILAEEVSQTDVRDGKQAATKLAEALTHAEPQHTMLGSPREVALDGKSCYRLDYAQQTFPGVQHYFCSVVTVIKGYALRLSVIADSRAHMESICATTDTVRFEK